MSDSGTYAALLAQHGTYRAAALSMGIKLETFKRRYYAEVDGQPMMPRVGPRPVDVTGDRADTQVPNRPAAGLRMPRLPSPDVPVDELIRRLAADEQRRHTRAQKEKWHKIEVLDPLPIACLAMGDPHLGTSTNWGRLRKDVNYLETEPGLYGLNIGDTTNNWTGRLIRQYADESISRSDERRLAQWLLGSGTWMAWLFGNHDEWEHGSAIMQLMDPAGCIPMHNWGAKFELIFSNRTKVRIHCAHDFPGHSMWNPTHGPARSPRMMGTDADVFVGGHIHEWGLQQFEMAERALTPWAIRLRGYKRGDKYAKTKGYQESNFGASVLLIFDPYAETPPGRVIPFADVDQGIQVLRALRARSQKQLRVAAKPAAEKKAPKRPARRRAGKPSPSRRSGRAGTSPKRSARR